LNESNSIRLAGIAYGSLVNGPGLRRVLFSQGCRHNCRGCFNPETHSFTEGKLCNMDEIIEEIKNDTIISGITFSGGDPFEQADKFAYIAGSIRETGKNIWCYTGYTFEYILENKEQRTGWNDLLNNIDVLIDGRFEEDKKVTGLKFRGSGNQRIIDVKESLKENKVIEYKI
jgi:anaerobic ribonucleoside-triphosphate reductase activating protein